MMIDLFNVLKIKHSYSKKGYPYDNASRESFNVILKKEEVNVFMPRKSINLGSNLL